MSTHNPLVEPEGAGNFTPIPDGEYACKFVGVEVVRGKKYQSEDEEDKLKWSFSVLSESHTLSKRTSLSTWAKPGTESGVVKFLKLMDPIALKKCPKSGEHAYTKEGLWSLIQKLTGQYFAVQVELVEDKFNNILNLRKISQDEAKALLAKKEVEPVAPSKNLKEVSLDDDSIPF